MLPQKIFEKLHAVMANLVKIFDPNSECFAKYDIFCSHIFDYGCLRRKAYCYQRGSKL